MMHVPAGKEPQISLKTASCLMLATECWTGHKDGDSNVYFLSFFLLNPSHFFQFVNGLDCRQTSSLFRLCYYKDVFVEILVASSEWEDMLL